MKTKTCATCKVLFATLYRVQIIHGKNWVFICEKCLLPTKLLPDYRYGGTWQGKRH